MKYDAAVEEMQRELLLSKQRVATRRAISTAMLADMKISAEFAPWLDALVVGLDAYIWKANDHKELAARYPATWWDAFKLRWFPLWAEQRWPAEYKEVWVTTSILYPDLILPNQRHATMLTFDRTGTDEDTD